MSDSNNYSTVVEKFCTTEVATSYIRSSMNKGKDEYVRKTPLGKWIAKCAGKVGRQKFWDVYWIYPKQALQ